MIYQRQKRRLIAHYCTASGTLVTDSTKLLKSPKLLKRLAQTKSMVSSSGIMYAFCLKIAPVHCGEDPGKHVGPYVENRSLDKCLRVLYVSMGPFELLHH